MSPPVRPELVEGPVSQGHTVAVAVSGGRDSMTLLHCTARAGRMLGVQTVALHVHHGLLAQADGWEAQVRETCRRWKVGFEVQRLTGRPGRGESVEAWARAARYAALTAMARSLDVDLVLLAHHRRDQAETFLLQALRGGGPRGLAAMPERAERDGIVWARPWLRWPREAIDAYARRHRIAAVDDPSNADPRFARSRLREAAMPSLRAAFADADASLARAAARCGEAQAVLDEVAALDLSAVASSTGLRVAAWRQLSQGRRANALRHWLRQQAGRGTPDSLVERLLDELPRPGDAQWPFGEHMLRRHRGRLLFVTASVSGPSAVGEVPEALRLRTEPVAQGGVAESDLLGATWRPRQGGERFQRHARTPARSLKKQFQEADVPAWLRDVPLLYAADGRLLFVPGLGIDARVIAAPGLPQRALHWIA